MTAQLLSSKVSIEEEAPSSRTITSAETGVLAATGLTPRGPVGVATPLFSNDDFVRIFGGDTGIGYAAAAMKGFFDNGGRRAYFTRVVHYSDITEPLSKTSAAGRLNLLSSVTAPAPAQLTGTITGPFQLSPADTLVVSRDAVVGTSTATFSATAASLSDGEGAGPWTLEDNQTLQIRIDNGGVQTIIFDTSDFLDISAATQAEVVAAIAAQLADAVVSPAGEGFTIASTTKGTHSSVQIVGGTATGALGMSAGIAVGTGNVADITAVTIAEIKTIVEAAVSGVTVVDYAGGLRITASVPGTAGKLQIQSASTAADELGLDTVEHRGNTGNPQATLRIDAKFDGTYSSRITVLVSPSTSGIPAEFNLSVLQNGVIVETFPNLTMFNNDVRHVEKILNDDQIGSRYIVGTDLRVAPGFSNAITERPANSLGSPAAAFGPLVGGNDGLTGISEIDFVGDSSSHTGFYSFDFIADADLLICPEVATPAVHNAALQYVSVQKGGEMFFIADPPAGLRPAGINEYVVTTAALKNTTEFGAIYWPRIKVLNPNTSVYGLASTIIVPPSGHIAGMFARSDGNRVGGVYDPPGGVIRGQLFGALGFESDEVLSEPVRDFIAPNLINPITKLRGHPIAVDDVMTLLSGGAFPTVSERRGVSYIERSVKDSTQFARLENNDETLRTKISRTVTAFLLIQMRCKAFRSQNPRLAFFVDTSDAINPPTEQFANRVNIRVGLATNKPGRFIIFKFSQDTRALDEELAAAAG